MRLVLSQRFIPLGHAMRRTLVRAAAARRAGCTVVSSSGSGNCCLCGLVAARRHFVTSSSSGGSGGGGLGSGDEFESDLQRELDDVIGDADEPLFAPEDAAGVAGNATTAAAAGGGGAPTGATQASSSSAAAAAAAAAASSAQDASTRSIVQLVPVPVPPSRYDLMANASVFKWETKAVYARKVTGPMREWCDEIKYRTGVHVEMEPANREKLLAKGGYASADDVDVVVYFFGAERAIRNCVALLDAAIEQDPMYVRLGVFRRLPDGSGVQWLTLRRINRDFRPPDIPPVSLKLPGKWTLMFENPKEAAIRTLWEETGIRVEAKNVFASSMLRGSSPEFFWRVPVRYFVAEVPYDVKVTGPHSASTQYMQGWDARLLRQSPDPIDRVWAAEADPTTGCAWLTSKVIDQLQEPLKGPLYMAQRYTPPPISGLQEVLGLEPIDENTPGFTRSTG